MNLIIDIGNTRTKAGVFDSKELIHFEIWEKGWSISTLENIFQRFPLERSALSTVAELAPEVVQFLRERTYFLQLSASTPLPIQNHYSTPATLGKDRLAAVVGAYAQFPNTNCLVVDAGTCITCDFIDLKGNYHGGSISPGIQLRLKAMHQLTARLPLIETDPDPIVIGHSTATAMQSGAEWGAIWEVNGYRQYYMELFGQIEVIVTGGDANFFANHSKTKIFVVSELVLIGLNEILIFNVENVLE